MPVVCGVCNGDCADGDVKCVGGCAKVFHAKCTDADGRKTRSLKDWKCKNCRLPSSGESSAVKESVITKEFFVKFMEEYRNAVGEDMKGVKADINGIRSSLEFMSSMADENKKIMEQVREELKAIKKENGELRAENSSLKSEVYELRERVRSLEQYTRKNNIEISGIPVTPAESVMDIVRDVGKALGVEVPLNQVNAAHRIPSFKKDRIPSLVVQFQCRSWRDTLIAKFREKKSLSAREVNASYQNSKVYVNEHLSPENKLFLSKLKEKCREIGYAYAWFREGKFFVRKAQGETCKRISTMEEIVNLK